MSFGSESERTLHHGECRTTEDVRLLFERYRAEARHFDEILGNRGVEELPAREPEPAREPTLLAAR